MTAVQACRECGQAGSQRAAGTRGRAAKIAEWRMRREGQRHATEAGHEVGLRIMMAGDVIRQETLRGAA